MALDTLLLTFIQIRRKETVLMQTPESIAEVNISIYRIYANRTHDPIAARKFNSRNFLYSIRTEATVCNYFL